MTTPHHPEFDWDKAPVGATHVNGAGVFLRVNRTGSVSEFDFGTWCVTSKVISDFNPAYLWVHPTEANQPWRLLSEIQQSAQGERSPCVASCRKRPS